MGVVEAGRAEEKAKGNSAKGKSEENFGSGVLRGEALNLRVVEFLDEVEVSFCDGGPGEGLGGFCGVRGIRW